MISRTRIAAAAAAAAAAALAMPAAAQVPTGQQPELRPDQREFLSLYEELVETNTTLSSGSCTHAAEQIGKRLKAAGFPDSAITLFSVPEHPREGGIVAVLEGTSKTAKPMLLLAHIDVVEAKREDWERDPFTLVEENGYYYARGITDDKFQAAVWADTLIRLHQSGKRPARSIKMALTCGEESDRAFNGAQYLATQRKDLIDAAFALNEGGIGRTDGKGKLLLLSFQVGEKVYQDYTLTATNPGGHSSAPPPDNAIYAMAAALQRIGAYTFPAEFNETTRAFFTKSAPLQGGELGAAMTRITQNLGDAQAMEVVNRDRSMRSMLRTTCVATQIEGGHAPNALPQRVTANVNCRIFPGHSPAEIKTELEKVIADPAIRVTLARTDKPVAVLPPLDPAIVGPVESLAAKHFPGVPVIPTMLTGATDGVYTGNAGIPTYGVPSVWTDPDGNGVHGLNERLEVRAVYTVRDYLFDLVGALANPK